MSCSPNEALAGRPGDQGRELAILASCPAHACDRRVVFPVCRSNPRHPDEFDLHHELRDAFNKELQNANFFVWIDVRPTGKYKQLAHLDKIIEAVEEWLGDLDPDGHLETDRIAERWIVDPAAEIKLRAIPRKREVRGYRADQIVGNPEPILVGWVE